MSKIKAVGSNKLLYSFVLKSVISSVLSVLLGIILFSVLIYKLDISLDLSQISGVVIVLFSSVIVAYISVGSIKNNGSLMGIISEIPIMFYVLVNLIFSNTSLVMFIVKIVVCLLSGLLVGFARTKQNRKFKVK
ncbi:MAG: DUF3792 family protein [Eubacterium sp.]